VCLRHDRGHLTVWQRAHHRGRRVGWYQRLTRQRRAEQPHLLGRQRRQVGQRLVPNLAAVAEGAPQQM
jgi:hypothetical protein